MRIWNHFGAPRKAIFSPSFLGAPAVFWRFSEVEGGLNQITLKRFEQLLKATDLHIVKSEGIPIGATCRIYCRPLREFLTSAVRCPLCH